VSSLILHKRSTKYEIIVYDFNSKRFYTLPSSYYLLIKLYLADHNFQVRYSSYISSITPIKAGVVYFPRSYTTFTPRINLYTLIAEYIDVKPINSINSDPLLASINIKNHLHLMENGLKTVDLK